MSDNILRNIRRVKTMCVQNEDFSNTTVGGAYRKHIYLRG